MDTILQLDQNILLFIQEYIRHDWMVLERDHTSWRFWNLLDSSYNRSADS